MTEVGEKLRGLVDGESTSAASIGGVAISVGVTEWEPATTRRKR